MYQFDMIYVYGFSQGQKVCNDIKIVYISNFSQFWSRGGGHRKSIFSQIQKSPNYPRGGGGQENYGLFPQIMVFFILNRPLIILIISCLLGWPWYFPRISVNQGTTIIPYRNLSSQCYVWANKLDWAVPCWINFRILEYKMILREPH